VRTVIRYKGVNIWWNEVQLLWMLQSGLEIIGTAKTISAAKAKISKMGRAI
jgi:hypothetical protein